MVRRTVRNVQPIDPHTLENIGKATPMVLIPMRDHNTVEPKDMIARQGRPSRLPYPRIDKQRRRPVAYQDRISLPDIEHNDLGRSKAGPIGNMHDDTGEYEGEHENETLRHDGLPANIHQECRTVSDRRHYPRRLDRNERKRNARTHLREKDG